MRRGRSVNWSVKYDSQKVGCQRHVVSFLTRWFRTAVQRKQIRPTDRSGNADMREINAMSPAKVDNNDIRHCSLYFGRRKANISLDSTYGGLVHK